MIFAQRLTWNNVNSTQSACLSDAYKNETEVSKVPRRFHPWKMVNSGIFFSDVRVRNKVT